MGKTPSFGEVLEEVEQLSIEDKEALIDIVHRRIIEQRRAEIVGEVREGREEFRSGKVRAVTPDELMQDTLP